MLLARWQKTLNRFRDCVAIHDGDETLTFDALSKALDEMPKADGPVIAAGSAKKIILATLQGWRDGQVVLPMEKPEAYSPDAASIPDGVAHLKLTPGNDGQPRTVRFTEEQIAADADRLVDAMGLTPEIPNLATISLAHSYGYSSVVLPLLLHGIPLQTVEVPFPAVVTEAWSQHEKVVVPAVPSMWRAWLRSGILDGAPIALAISAGAPLPLKLEQDIWDAHRLKIHNFYGASECGGISWDATETPRTQESDLGTPLPGVEVFLKDGIRFVVKSSSVAMGYDHSRGDHQIENGQFLTADCGHLEGARIHLDTRADGPINVAGRKLGPSRVENILTSSGGLSRARVFGLPSSDPDRVDDVAAMVPEGSELAKVKAAISQQLAGWEMPRQWFFSDEDADYKLSRQELRKRFTK